jgi:ribosomal protein S18 acetylase RimI-like enzyme
VVTIRAGLPAGSEDRAADLYWEAFGTKLGIVMGPRQKGLAFVRRVIDSNHAFSAIDDTGKLLGVAGFKTYQGALVGGTFADMRAIYGTISALWRAAAISLLERDTENKRFLMDGVFVTPEARGQGIGTALLDAIIAEAAKRGYDAVRLDVIDTNPRARALYARHGFQPIKTSELGLLKHLFRFSSATTMVRDLHNSGSP